MALLNRDLQKRSYPLAAIAAGALLFTACASEGPGAADGDSFYVGNSVEWIVPTSAGGGFDTTARQLQPALEEALGASITIRTSPGGGHAVGTQQSLNATQDCSTILFQGIPHFNFSFLTQTVDYDASDFAPVVGVSVEPSVIRVRDDAPWNSLNEMIEDARQRPGQIKVSVSNYTSNNYIGLLALQRAAGVEFDIISYDGGGPSRTAVLSGEVDATHAGAFNSLSIEDGTKVLAVQQPENAWPDITDNAPTMVEVLGTEVADNQSNYIVLVPKGCADDYPERYEELQAGFQAALSSQRYLDMLADLGESDKLQVLSGDEVSELIDTATTEIRESGLDNVR